ncbi:MAG: maleylpyruvate isomerase N-terminal domain-containing protein, partial [Actinomycetota bacterium]
MDVLSCLEEVESRLRDMTEDLTKADLDRPTPCTEWDVRALVSHTLGAMEMYAAFVDGDPPPDFEAMMAGRDVLGDDPHGAVVA